MRAILKSMFDDAREVGILKDNPCASIRRFCSAQPQMRVFTKREQSAIERYCVSDGGSECLGILIALYTGVRIGELLALRWSDVDLRARIMRIKRTKYYAKDTSGQWCEMYDTPKSKSSEREIPIAALLCQILSRHKRKSTCDNVIADENGKSPNIRKYQYFFAKMQTNIVKNPLNFHALRHTFATRAMEAGVDIKTLSELMGYKDATLTLNRYSPAFLIPRRKPLILLQAIWALNRCDSY